jgi:hypothetical protein
MLIYQNRPRGYVFDGNEAVVFPADCRIRFHLAPKQVFGSESAGGRTTFHGRRPTFVFDPHTGVVTFDHEEPPTPVVATGKYLRLSFLLKGHVLEISGRFNTGKSVTQIIERVYYVLPLVLSIDLADPLIIEKVDGEIGGEAFYWGILKSQEFTFELVSEADQESWCRMSSYFSPA